MSRNVPKPSGETRILPTDLNDVAATPQAPRFERTEDEPTELEGRKSWVSASRGLCVFLQASGGRELTRIVARNQDLKMVVFRVGCTSAAHVKKCLSSLPVNGLRKKIREIIARRFVSRRA